MSGLAQESVERRSGRTVSKPVKKLELAEKREKWLKDQVVVSDCTVLAVPTLNLNLNP
jgi:hypothetical protein